MKQFSINLGSTGGSGNAFSTVTVPSGTNPTASGSASLVFTSSNSSVVIVGNSATNTIDFTTSAGGGNVTGTTLTTLNALSKWGNTTGSLLLNSGLIADSSNNLTGVNSINLGASLNQLSFGTTFLMTLNANALGASRTISFADPGANDNIAYVNAAQTLLGKSLSGLSNTITNLSNAAIVAGASIALSKLADLPINRAVGTNGSGVLIGATASFTELNFLVGVSLGIQTQFASTASLSFVTMQTDLGTSPVADGPNDTLIFTSSDSSVKITGNSGTDTINFQVTAGSAGLTLAYVRAESQGVTLTQRSILNFTGNGLAAVDNSGNTRTDVSLNAGVYTRAFGAGFDGQSLPLSSSAHVVTVQVPYAGTITEWTAWAVNQTGSIQYDVQRCSYANYPAGFSSIVASAPPSIVNGVKGTTTTMTGWSLAFNADDFFQFSITSGSSLTWSAIRLAAAVT